MAAPRLSDAEIARTLAALREAGGSRAEAARKLGMKGSTLKTRIKAMTKLGVAVPPSPAPNAPGSPQRAQSSALGRLAQLLERSGIDPDEIGRVEKIRINEWDGFSKDDEGNPVVTRLQGESIVLAPKWESGPAWSVVAQAPAVTIASRRTSDEAPSRPHKVCVVAPDMQINYHIGKGSELIATHDEGCLSILLDVIEDADPDVVAMNGDNLDLSELSRFRKFPIFQRMTQPTIDRAGRLLASIRARVRPECEIKWIEGNHEARLGFYILDNAQAAYGLKRANMPESWPVLSVPHLCRFDEYGVDYVSGYPASGFYLNENLKIIHGNKVRSAGSTAVTYLTEMRTSVCYGHTHREEVQTVTRENPRGGPRTYEAFSFGCLCRTDGSVPGAESGYDAKHGQPVKTQNNWTNGIGVIEYDEGDGLFWREHIRIWGGRTRWRGKSYHAPDTTEAA